MDSLLAWRVQSIELLALRWPGYYRFEIENDSGWHDKIGCWLGSNIKENKKVAVLCCRNEAKQTEIDAFVDYVESLDYPLNKCEFLIIIQQGYDEKERLAKQGIKIKQYSESYLLNNLVDFEDYFLDLKKRVEYDCLPDSELVLPDIYVPSAINNEDGDAIKENLEEYLQNWLNETGQRQLALLGEYGQGKSTGTLMFSYQLMQQGAKQASRIPILLELRGKSPKTLEPS